MFRAFEALADEGVWTVLIRNGKAGFRAIMQSITETSDYLAAQLEATGRYASPRHAISLERRKLKAPFPQVHHYEPSTGQISAPRGFQVEGRQPFHRI